MDNKCLMQYFEWNLPADGILWRRAAAQAESLKSFGIDAVWLPPAYKGAAGGFDVGYGVYDLYDLGEFDQKGSVRTKYGTRDEYLACVKALQKQGIRVMADIVLDHRMGADAVETVQAEKFDPDNRTKQVSGTETIEAWTKYTFPGRGGKYSKFEWNWTCFSGIDWDEQAKQGGVYRFAGKEWSPDVDNEKGNFDYLMGADVDMSADYVARELTEWGKWYINTTGIDSLRLDAVKHIDYGFYGKWLKDIRQETDEPLFTVGEYWSGDLTDLTGYLSNTGDTLSLFDVPLHYNFFNASRGNGGYNMATLLQNTLVAADAMHAVTFVDNHDSQPGQSLESWVEDWFKPLAYAVILLRLEGLPCVFYGDYYGMPVDGKPPVPGLKRMLAARRDCAYGPQHDYFDHDSVVGFTREGDGDHPDSGCAVLLTDSDRGEKAMYVGKQHAGQVFRDITRLALETVTVDKGGNGLFKVPGGGVSVWLPEAAFQRIAIECE